MRGHVCGELRHVWQTRMRSSEISDGRKVFPVVIATEAKGEGCTRSTVRDERGCSRHVNS